MASGGGGVALQITDGRNDATDIADHLKRLCNSDHRDSIKKSSFAKSCGLTTKMTVENEKSAESEIISERDEMWRQHEKAQISFLQAEHQHMLTALHAEIERLQQFCRDLQANINISSAENVDQEGGSGANELSNAKGEVRRLKELLERKDLQIVHIEERFDNAVHSFRDEIGHQSRKIRQLNSELNERTATVAQLSSQLRTVRLKEAMLQAQQRRRASLEAPRAHRPGPGSPRFDTDTMVRKATVSINYPTVEGDVDWKNAKTLPPIHPSGTSTSTQSAPGPAADSNNIEKPNCQTADCFKRKWSLRSINSVNKQPNKDKSSPKKDQ